MLDWLGEKNSDTIAVREAQKIERAIRKLLKRNKKTIDIGGKLSTSEFTDSVIGEMY